jgi:hypothetical protein
MRAAPLLAAFGALEVGLVVLLGLLPHEAISAEPLRRPLLSIIAITGIGVLALVGLSFAARLLARLRGDASRALGGMLLGGAYAVATLGCLGWTALWFSPTSALVAFAGLACAGLLLWQLWAEDELRRDRIDA